MDFGWQTFTLSIQLLLLSFHHLPSTISIYHLFFGGEGGIRTLGAPDRGTTVFETAAFNQLCHLSILKNVSRFAVNNLGIKR